MAVVHLQAPLVSVDDYLAIFFSPPEDGQFRLIPFSIRDPKRSVCRSSTAMKVYMRKGIMTYRVVQFCKADDDSKFQYLTQPMRLKKKKDTHYKLTGKVDSSTYLNITFNVSKEGRVHVKWFREGFASCILHVCSATVTKLLEEG